MIFYHLQRITPALFLVISLVGCVDLDTHNDIFANNNTQDKNLTASLSKSSDDGTKARVDIYNVDEKCQTAFDKTISLNNIPSKIKIRANKQTLLAFYFLNSDPRWYVNSKSSINVDALIRARAGYRYEAYLSYVDNIYDISIFEIQQRSEKRTAINIVGMEACH